MTLLTIKTKNYTYKLKKNKTMKNINTLSENQQRIINSLVNEFEKINQPTFISNGGLVDWSKINQDK